MVKLFSLPLGLENLKPVILVLFLVVRDSCVHLVCMSYFTYKQRKGSFRRDHVKETDSVFLQID